MKGEPSSPPQCQHCEAAIERCGHCGTPCQKMICVGPVGGPMKHLCKECDQEYTLYYPATPPPMTADRRDRVQRIQQNHGRAFDELLAEEKFCGPCIRILRRSEVGRGPCKACYELLIKTALEMSLPS